MRWVPSWRGAGACVGGVLVAVACSRSSHPDQGIERMRADIASLQLERQRLAERLSILEMEAQRRAPAERKLPETTAGARELRPYLPVVRIGANGENAATHEHEHERNGDEVAGQAADASEPRALVHANGGSGSARSPARASRALDTGRQARRGTAVSSGADVPPFSPDGKQAYESALTLLRAKRYDAALSAFTAFLVRYPDHPSGDRAMYWRGECFYAQGDIARAQEQFEGVLARFPFGSKAADALLKLGMCQDRLGATAAAARTFADLKDRYPNSDAARQVPRL